MERPLLGPLHCEPIRLMSIGQRRRNVGRHPDESSLTLVEVPPPNGAAARPLPIRGATEWKSLRMSTQMTAEESCFS